MADVPIPRPIVDWIEQHNWSPHHLQWHAERRWDTMLPADRQAALQRGWRRADRQEGAAGNGYDFLLMHRAMIQILVEEFPQHRGWFLGWTTPPTDPDDPIDPVPPGSIRDFAPAMQQAIERLTVDPGAFADEDALGLYIETRRRPTAANPFAQSPDPSTGIHNYLHGRFSDPASPIDLGRPDLNLANARFWKLHGWIDARWSEYRLLHGMSDNDIAYQRALAAEKAAMRHLGGHGGHTLRAAALSTGPTAAVPLTASLRNPHRETLAARVQRLMASTPRIETKEELVEYLQTAIQVEHATLPLYLTAMWSVKTPSSAPYRKIKRIALQEMLHMGIVCNLLKAIGASPAIAPPLAEIPEFPGMLPGLDLSDAGIGDVSLEALSRDRLDLFMRIELPQHDPLPLAARAMAVPRFRTIGEFYDVIIAGVQHLAANAGLTFDGPGQISYSIGPDELEPIASADDAVDQLKLIKEQGEGTTTSPNAPDGQRAHYYMFREILDTALPAPADIYPFPPVTPGLDPALHATFNRAYSRMLDRLQDAWNGDPDALDEAIWEFMLEMTRAARELMEVHAVGPEFRYVASAAPAMAGAPGPLALMAAGARAAALPGFARVQEILDAAVGGADFPGHGRFWQGVTRDEFVAKRVFGRALIALRPDGSFDPDASNLVKSLEGRAPFGSDLVPRPPGAIFKRMPDGFPPVPQPQIDEIRMWIDAGCPEFPPAAAPLVEPAGGVTMTPDDYVRFWRQFDDAALFHATPQVESDVNEFFAVADRWLAFAHDPAQAPAWTAALADPAVAAAVQRLEQLQRTVIVQAFGTPASLGNLLDAFERFGDDTLPDDPLRTVDPRHTMNGEIMWFFWSAFADACLRAGPGSPIPADFWKALSRAILLGLMNDGVFRGRFPVLGFDPTLDGKAAMREHVRALPDVGLAAELARRYRESGL